MVQPQVVPIAGVEIDYFGVREEGDVDRVVRVMVAQEDVGHGLGRDAQFVQRIHDRAAARDHARVHDDPRIAVAD
ncbi:MAG: hypothetical protein WKF78_03485 [Candidatus Limnocylindrales bacterium]